MCVVYFFHFLFGEFGGGFVRGGCVEGWGAGLIFMRLLFADTGDLFCKLGFQLVDDFWEGMGVIVM